MLSHKYIQIEDEQCIGCKNCQIVCATSHRSIPIDNYHQLISGVKFHFNLTEKKSYVCAQCEEKHCMHVCKNNAIQRINGIVKIIESKCVGCGECVDACPENGIFMYSFSESHRVRGKRSIAVKCDLCSDSVSGPVCIQASPRNAIKLVETPINYVEKEKEENPFDTGLFSNFN